MCAREIETERDCKVRGEEGRIARKRRKRYDNEERKSKQRRDKCERQERSEQRNNNQVDLKKKAKAELLEEACFEISKKLTFRRRMIFEQPRFERLIN